MRWIEFDLIKVLKRNRCSPLRPSTDHILMDLHYRAISRDVFPYLRVYTDGTVERTAGTEMVLAGLDSDTDVLSKDIVVAPETGTYVRLYCPNILHKDLKLPLVVYFHGGAFCVASPAEPKYHAVLNRLVAEAYVIAASVDYRLAPEHPLPAAYEDSWAALRWVASHIQRIHGVGDQWLADYVDFEQVYLAGDSAGANIAHHLGLRAKEQGSGLGLRILGMCLIHPYFWGKDPIGLEVHDPIRKGLVDNWWTFVCPSEKGCDDPLINPFAYGAPSLKDLDCQRVLVMVAEKDILRDRGKLYYENLRQSRWKGTAELVEAKEADHVFHIFDVSCANAKTLIKRIAAFLNKGKEPLF